jgi:broad specificity phosphatase PhoE
MKESGLEEKIKQLTPEEREQVLKFIDEILSKKPMESSDRKLTFEWAGALADLKDQYTSVELQKQINEWRIEKFL